MEVHALNWAPRRRRYAAATTFGAEAYAGVPGVHRSFVAAGRQRRGGESRRSASAWHLNCPSGVERLPRKNYFYPISQLNYQISQYDEPIAFDGHLDVVARRRDAVARRDRARHWRGYRCRCTSAVPGASTVPAIRCSTLQPRQGPAGGSRHPTHHRRRRARPRWLAPASPPLRDLLKALGASDVRMDQGSLLRRRQRLAHASSDRRRVRHAPRRRT